MRGFVVRSRNEEAMIFFTRGGKKGTAQARADKIGVSYVESFRPQLAYLRGEIGRRDARWDTTVVEALALVRDDPAASVRKWDEASALGYPRDELDSFARNLASWRLGREFSSRKVYDSVHAEFKTMPRLYAAFLEDLAYASGQIDLLESLRLADVDSSTVSGDLLAKWEAMAAKPTAERSLLDLAAAGRGRDLLPDLAILPEDKLPGAEERMERLKNKGSFTAPPDRIHTTRVRFPDDDKDCHIVLAFRLCVPKLAETASCRARLGLYAGRGGKRLDQPVLAEITVATDPFSGTHLLARGGFDGALHRHHVPGKAIPVADGADEVEETLSETFRIDLIRLGNEAAAYCDGIPFCHLPIDPAVENFELQWLVSGLSAEISSFEAWALNPEKPLTNP
jgi:hypothetical protein